MIGNKIVFICDSIRNKSLILHPDNAKALGITIPQKQRLKFGIQSSSIEITISDTLQFNQASLSSDIIQMLEIPLSCHYEIKQEDDVIQVGPYIGLLAGFNEKSVKNRLQDLLDYVYHYKVIKGAIVVFSLDNVDKVQYRVKGFLFNPETNEWDEGTFSYPSAIFIMTGTVSSKWVRHFQTVIGDCVFNDFYFNKWSIHKRLADAPQVKNYLPDSILYKTPENIHSFLQKYPNVIVKSINASKGSSIYKISLDGDQLLIDYPKKGKTNIINVQDREKALVFFKDYFAEREFMIQEVIDLISYENRAIDFRVIVVKNQQGKWGEMGIFARHGKPGSILSNISPIVKWGKGTLEQITKLSNSKTDSLLKEISTVAIESVKAIEKTGVHFANAGVDIAVDQKGEIWFIEIQHCNPSHDIAMEAGSNEWYYEILKANMLYAKRLAGFPINS